MHQGSAYALGKKTGFGKFWGFANKWTHVSAVHTVINKMFFRCKVYVFKHTFLLTQSTKRFEGEVGWTRNC